MASLPSTNPNIINQAVIFSYTLKKYVYVNTKNPYRKD